MCFYRYLLVFIFSLLMFPGFSQINKLKKLKRLLEPQDVEMDWLDTYEALGREYAGGGAEIAAYDPKTKHVFITNGQSNALDIIKISSAGKFEFVVSIDLSAFGDGPNSVAVGNDLVALTVDGTQNTDGTYNEGKVVFFDAYGNLKRQIIVGHIPDMVTFTPNGKYAIIANEAEPNADYTFDPEGSISIIDANDFSVRTADFRNFNENIHPDVRIFGPGATVAQDLEPEYIGVSHNSQTAFVSLQENNAMAVVDLKSATVTDIYPLGTKDFSLEKNAFDASNKDGGINMQSWPVKGFYMPDAIATYKFRDQTLIVSANEGDARDYNGFSEEARVKDLNLDPLAFPNASELQKEENLGRLKITTANGDANKDGLYEEIYAYGARSFSIWNEKGKLIYDSKDDFERILADILPEHFNSTNDEGMSFDNRSDDKGPEPEGLTLGRIGEKTYAFIGLERIGGVMVYDITNPYRPVYKSYINNRNFDVEFDEDNQTDFLKAGDLGPEGLLFIQAKSSSTGTDLLLVANEVSGTTSLFEVSTSKKEAIDLLSANSKILAYPNPVTDRIFIDVSTINETNLNVEIISIMDGQVFFAKEFKVADQPLLEISVDDLPNQIYVVKLKGKNHNQQFRMLKQ